MRSRTLRKTRHRKAMKKTTVRNFEYPDKTAGSELASEVRKKASQLSEQERERCLEEGMQIIYGGSAAKNHVRSGH